MNAEWVGVKSLIVERSIGNIFFPVQYDAHMERWVKGWGAYKVYAQNDFPKDFEIIDEHVYANEEYYWCRYKYRDNSGKLKFDEGLSRVRWKTWEYYYEADILLTTPENVKKQIEKDKADIEKRKKEIEEAKKKEKELLESEPKTSKEIT